MDSQPTEHPPEFIKFADIIPDLGDDELGARSRLFAQLGVLGKTFPFALFEG